MKNVTITENGLERETTEADFEIKEYTQLSEDEVLAQQAAYALSNYQEMRADAFPPMADYLDGIVKGDTAQVDKYIADCLAVKTKYPKPTGA